ncbi:rRNA methylase [Caldibacillus debilis GB1]|jgi:RNA methyltransferase, TrmH family|uniref:rRNA methylase n=2 Tax=Caldibacillus debilis TaxID=301148 RepID=A0A420VIL2_9BACI|nr:rRNA methylase [Caldibacillus debilis GB1]
MPGQVKKMKRIQSAKNEKVKRWKKLLTKKERDKAGLFLVEGEHLVEEAGKAGLIRELIVTERFLGQLPAARYGADELYLVSEEVGKAIADTETPQGIFAVCGKPEARDPEGKRFLLIDAVQDPGNLGTLIRTADAAGLDGVVVGEGSADIYNPKVVRATQGSLFHLPVLPGSLEGWVETFRSRGIPVYGTALTGVSMYEIGPAPAFALLVGNEARGVDPRLLEKTDANLHIPIYGMSESLNVSVAAGILLYHLRGRNSG